jgi:hypothetical protein
VDAYQQFKFFWKHLKHSKKHLVIGEVSWFQDDTQV